MALGRIRADHHDDVGLEHRIEILGAGRRAEGGLESIAGRRMADARAGIDVVVAEGRAHQLLHQVRFLVGAARRRDAADRAATVLRLHALQLARRVSRSPRPTTLPATGRSIRSRIIGLRTRSGWVA